ncbi:hypothetical protein YC2023_000683 [Brassica napus]
MRSLRWSKGQLLYFKDSQFREGDRAEYQFRITATVLDNVTQKQMLKFLRLQLSCSIHVLKLDGYVRSPRSLPNQYGIVGELRARELLHLHPVPRISYGNQRPPVQSFVDQVVKTKQPTPKLNKSGPENKTKAGDDVFIVQSPVDPSPEPPQNVEVSAEKTTVSDEAPSNKKAQNIVPTVEIM